MEVAFISRFDNRKPKQPDELVNEKIRFKEVLVIDQNGDQLGVKSRNQAIDIAYGAGLDLVCVRIIAPPLERAPKARTICNGVTAIP